MINKFFSVRKIENGWIVQQNYQQVYQSNEPTMFIPPKERFVSSLEMCGNVMVAMDNDYHYFEEKVEGE